MVLGVFVGRPPDPMPSYREASERWAIKERERSWGRPDGGLIRRCFDVISKGGSVLRLANEAGGVLSPPGARPGVDHVLERELSIESFVQEHAQVRAIETEEGTTRSRSRTLLYALDSSQANALADDVDRFICAKAWPGPLGDLLMRGGGNELLERALVDGLDGRSRVVFEGDLKPVGRDLLATVRLIGLLRSPPDGAGIRLFLSVSDGSIPSFCYIVAHWIDFALAQQIIEKKDETKMLQLGLAFARRLPMESFGESHGCLPRTLMLTISESRQMGPESDAAEFMLVFLLKPLGLLPVVDKQTLDGVRELSEKDLRSLDARFAELGGMNSSSIRSEISAFWNGADSSKAVRATIEAVTGSEFGHLRRLIQRAMAKKLPVHVARCMTYQ